MAQDPEGFFNSWLEEVPVVSKLIVVGKNRGLYGFVPLALKANSVAFITSHSGDLGALLFSPGIERGVYVYQLDGRVRNRLQDSKIVSEVDGVCGSGHRKKVNSHGT